MKAVILSFFIFIFMYSSSQCLAQSSNPILKINGYDYFIKVNEEINCYREFTHITDKKIRTFFEEQFVPFLVNYRYSNNFPVYFLTFPVQNLVASVDKESKIAAIHVSCNYTDGLMDSINLNYGIPSGVIGLTTNDNESSGNEFGILRYANGSVLVSKSRNSLFFSEISNMKDIVVISFINLESDYKDYLSIYN